MKDIEKLTNTTTALIKDLTTQAMVIATVFVIFLLIYFLIRRAATADDMNVQHWNKRIMVAIVSYVGVLVAGIVIGIVTSYYGNLGTSSPGNTQPTQPTTTTTTTTMNTPTSVYVQIIEKGEYYV